MVNLFALISSLVITTISGFISIVGLTTLFSAKSSYYIIIALASALEMAKISAVTWVHHHWWTSNKVLKYYLMLVIFILMITNSLSAFGFLSRAHIETESNIRSTNNVELVTTESNLKNQQDMLNDTNIQIKAIDDSVHQLMVMKKVNSSISASAAQKKSRDVLINKKEEIQKKIGELQTKEALLKNDAKKTETEVGPLKYVAQLFYGSDDPALVEKAVRFVIVLLVMVFDPLAVALLVGSLAGFKEKRLTYDPNNPNMISIRKDKFLRM